MTHLVDRPIDALDFEADDLMPSTGHGPGGHQPEPEATRAAFARQERARVIVVHPDAAVRGRLEQLSRGEGFDVVACGTAAELMRLAKQQAPAVVVIDVDLPHNDAGRCVGVLRRCYQTSAVAVLLTGPTPRRMAEIEDLIGMPAGWTAAQFVALLHETALRAAKRRAHDAKLLRRVPPTRRLEANNSLLVRTVHCPFHDQPAVPLTRHMLRTGRMAVDVNYFDVPVYRASIRGADYVNFHLLSVMVCPQCFFASSNPACFRDPADYRTPPVKYTDRFRAALAKDEPERRKIGARLSPAAFTHERGLDDAMIAYDLAVRCSQLQLQHNGTSPIELVRLGNYHLRVAQLLVPTEAPRAEIDARLRAALPPLKEAFTLLDGPLLYRTIYQIVTLLLTAGEGKSARQYLAYLADLERDADGKEKIAIHRYLPRCWRAWEDREDGRAKLSA